MIWLHSRTSEALSLFHISVQLLPKTLIAYCLIHDKALSPRFTALRSTLLQRRGVCHCESTDWLTDCQKSRRIIAWMSNVTCGHWRLFTATSVTRYTVLALWFVLKRSTVAVARIHSSHPSLLTSSTSSVHWTAQSNLNAALRFHFSLHDVGSFLSLGLWNWNGTARGFEGAL